MKCKFCGSENTIKNGHFASNGVVCQKIRCKNCNKESYITPENAKIEKSSIQKGLTEVELRAKHDITYKIKQAAESLSGDVYYTEYDFIQLCSIPSGTGFRHIVESGMFDLYRGKASGTVYWSNPGNIKKLKDEGVLK